MAKIFISHSSRNNQEAITVRDWLVSNGWDDVFLDLDPKRGLAPGEHWQEALKAAADRCQAVLFLISPDWLDSRWCRAEFLLAKMLGKAVFPVLIKDVDLQDLPAEMTTVLQVVDVRSLEGWEWLKEGLRRAGLDPETFRFAKGRPPYPGFEPLREDDAAIFFGREAQIVRGLDRLRVMSDAGAERVLVILVASGAGKSSFLRAGLWPRLQRDDRNFLPFPVIRPERGVISGSYGLLAALEAAASDPRVSQQLVGAGLPRSSGGIREMLESEETGLSRFLAALRRASAAGMLSPADAPQPTIVICVDQGEELLNEEGGTESKQFLAWLSQSLHPEEQTLLILAVRSDAYPRLQDKTLFSSLKPTPFDLPPMPVGSLRLVIEGPARVVDPPLKLEPQLVEALVPDASQPNSLPLLAFTLGRLYKAYGAEGGLTLSQYEKLGRISGAVRAAVNDAISQGKKKGVLPDDDAQIKKRLREAFIPHLARVNRAGLFLRRVATLEELPAHALPIIDLFVEQHLLVKDRRSPSEGNPGEAREVVEVAHEALLREWPDLKSWLVADREFLAFKDDLERDIAIWGSADDKQKTGALLSGLKLSKAQDWLFKRPQDLTEPERAYIRQSIDNEESHRRRTQNLWIGAGLTATLRRRKADSTSPSSSFGSFSAGRPPSSNGGVASASSSTSWGRRIASKTRMSVRDRNTTNRFD
jgi:hypothetical protein